MHACLLPKNRLGSVTVHMIYFFVVENMTIISKAYKYVYIYICIHTHTYIYICVCNSFLEWLWELPLYVGNPISDRMLHVLGWMMALWTNRKMSCWNC